MLLSLLVWTMFNCRPRHVTQGCSQRFNKAVARLPAQQPPGAAVRQAAVSRVMSAAAAQLQQYFFTSKLAINHVFVLHLSRAQP